MGTPLTIYSLTSPAGAHLGITATLPPSSPSIVIRPIRVAADGTLIKES